MILVTGGTGLIGSHLLFDLVSKGEHVRALHRKNSNLNNVRKIFSYYTDNANDLFSKIEWAEGDLLDSFSLEESIKDITHIYHCGAVVSMNPRDKTKMLHNNVAGTANILNIALEKKVQKFCYVSSVAALGITHDGSEITEETHWNERTSFSAYAVSKYLSEQEVWRASEEGLNTVIVNPTIVIGPGNWHRSSGVIFKTAWKGLPWYTSGGIAYVDARDVARSMIMLMKSDIKNERFIISSENMRFKNFNELIHEAIGKPLPDKKAGKLILEIVWRADKLKSILTGKSHILTKEIARYAVINLSYSNQKIKNTLGINFIPVSQSVQHTAKHFVSDFSGKKN